MGPGLIGRGDEHPEDTRPRLRFGPHRPGLVLPGPWLGGARISRQQLEIDPLPDGRLAIRSIGKCRLFVNGSETIEAAVRDGDTVHLRNALLMLVVTRPTFDTTSAAPPFDFGQADAFGIVGESAATWRLRHDLASVAQSGLHVLVHGPSGAGKELTARAIHRLSPRSTRPFVARNAATFTDTLIDAELFGNVKNFPNVGTPERQGLVGEANGGSLFLDEIGELPTMMQAHLLRLLDRDGEYHRLGEARQRRADVRIIAATNRAIEDLKHDFAARLTARVSLVGLDERPEDVPLIARVILNRLADQSPALGARFFERRGGQRAEARVAPELVEALVRHRWRLHVRELERVLWVAVSSSPGDYVSLTAEVERELGASAASPPPKVAELRITRPPPSRDEVVQALAAAQGRVAAAATALGLTSRYVLYRLMREHGIDGAPAAASSRA
ncbi:MAG: sigma-54-dependent Fis family transcriptional regulator [Deltaproteobacteria bacterium]|nr:sigma-54-dependent Fis family transcriptional regulator [Deltaproteobacteria bacterium]